MIRLRRKPTLGNIWRKFHQVSCYVHLFCLLGLTLRGRIAIGTFGIDFYPIPTFVGASSWFWDSAWSVVGYRYVCFSRLRLRSLVVTVVSRYIRYYLDLVATSDNVSLLYHLALKGKTVRDADSPNDSEVRPSSAWSLYNVNNVCLVSETILRMRTGSRTDSNPRS